MFRGDGRAGGRADCESMSALFIFVIGGVIAFYARFKDILHHPLV